MMRPIGFEMVSVAGGGGQTLVGYVSSTAGSNSPTVAFPGTIASGDSAMIVGIKASGGAFQVNDVSWTGGTTGFGGYARKILDSGDVSAGGVALSCQSGDPYVIAIYRGPTVITPKVANEGVGTSNVLTGFTKNGASLAVVSLFATHTANTISTPSGATSQVNTSLGAGADFNPSTLYSNSTSITWNYTVSANSIAVVFELR